MSWGVCWQMSRHMLKTYMFFTTYRQHICLKICLEGMCWEMSRHILKTYMFFTTYRQHICLEICLEVCVDKCQDISSRHICSSRYTVNTYASRYVLKVCVDKCQDISSRHICSSRHTVNTYVAVKTYQLMSRHMYNPQDISSRHTYGVIFTTYLQDIYARMYVLRNMSTHTSTTYRYVVKTIFNVVKVCVETHMCWGTRLYVLRFLDVPM